MPDGVVQWLDPQQDRAIVVRDAKTFTARLADLEPAARHLGAHVHFDVKRDGGEERAVQVSLRRGTRVTPRHRRFGTAVGGKGSVRAVAAGGSSATHRREVPTAGGTVPMAVTVKGKVDEDDVAYAARTVGAVLRKLSAPVLFSRLKLDNAPDPARPRPAIAQVSLDIGGESVRAQVAAHYMREAADLLARRLADRLDHRAQRMQDLHQRGPGGEAGEWRHGDLPAVRPGYFDRPPESRQLVRHKTFAVGEATPDEAVFDMEMADYDFYLFRDLASGQDSLVERRFDGPYRLTRLRPGTVADQPTAVPISVSDQAPPRLDVEEALERLDASGEERIFFVDSDAGRGSVAYRRYDGHYGLITTE